jgi:hypothetical protein
MWNRALILGIILLDNADYLNWMQELIPLSDDFLWEYTAHKFDIKKLLRRDDPGIRNWCEKNCKKPWLIEEYNGIIYFISRNDAMHFKLVWL